MKSKHITKILFLTTLILLIVFISLNITNKNSKADIRTIIPESEVKFNKDTSSKIVPIFDIDLESNIILIGNLNTGNVLYQKNAEQKTNIASITKLLSSCIVLENSNTDQIVNINNEIYNSLPSKTDLLLDENIKIIDLLKMALIMSSNDAITALAHYSDYYPFLSKMNTKANEIGMYNSHFDNPVGFDSEGNYTTAIDLFQLAKYVYNNYPLIGEITKSKAITITSDSNIKHLIIPTNSILDELQNYWGGKTGTTSKAKEALLSIFELENNNKKYPFVAIIIQSDNRFSDIKKISDWLSENKIFLTNY